MILDSGNRTDFGGAVRDVQKGKGRCDLLPLDVVSVLLVNPTIAYLNTFQMTGEMKYLYDALTASGIYHDMHTMLLEVAIHFEEGAEKYGERNWQSGEGIPVYCYINSAVRHYLKWLRGDTDENHNRAFCWNIICCIWTCINKPERNDYKKKQ
jgi:hypothetical protein